MAFEIDLLFDFGGFLVEKWSQVGTKIDPKSMSASKSVVKKNSFFYTKNNTFEGSGGQKNELNIGRSLDIDFCQNLVGFGAHVGGEKML